MRSALASLALTLSLTAAAAAEPIVLRLASVAPDGTAWAREIKAFGREVQLATSDEVQIKWYLSGIAGDELTAHERVKRDQLDGVISGGMLCQKLAPTMRAGAMAGAFRDRKEARYVMNQLRPEVDEELLKAGYVDVGPAGMGFSVVFSRTPVRSMADLKKLRPWLWSLDDTLKAQLDGMGLHPVPLPVEDGAHAFDDGRTDGFVALPSAALAFQWSTQAHYVIDLKVGYLTGCLLIARRAWDSLAHEQQQAVTGAAAKLQVRIEDVSQQIDHSLLSGLFAKQGLMPQPVPPPLQAEFTEAAHKSAALLEKLVPPGTSEKIQKLLSEYRAQTDAGETKAVRR